MVGEGLEQTAKLLISDVPPTLRPRISDSSFCTSIRDIWKCVHEKDLL